MKLSLFGVFLSVLYSQLRTSLTLKVSVYYETLCPDSISFISNQLHVNYKVFGPNWIQLELIPYGHAKENDTNGHKTFTCQHGPDECYGNKVHGCVINSASIAISEAFVFCSENSYSPASKDNLKQCADKYSISWSTIEDCMESGQADNIISKNGEKTNELNPRWIPAIAFNDAFNQNDSNQCENDFKGVVCKYLDNQPEQCQKPDPNVTLM